MDSATFCLKKGDLLRSNERSKYPPMLLIMRLTVLLLIAGILNASAHSIAQNTISFSGKEVGLEKVFLAIEQQTGYTVFCDYAILKSSRPVTLAVEKQPLDMFLQEALKGQGLGFTITKKTIVVKKDIVHPTLDPAPAIANEPLSPPSIDIRGHIVDEDDKPVAGASIIIKGTQRGTTTDDNGDFELKNVDPKAILVISGTNIEPIEEKLDGRNSLVLKAKPKVASMQEQAVVVGYGRQNKATLAGSATTIDMKQIRQQVTNNVGQVLQGNVSGLTVSRSSGDPASSYSIYLRGLSSVNNPATPLILIDGVPGSLTDVTPDMVQSITVLKDATTAGIYGSSSAGGVILITTRNGIGARKLTISYNEGVDNFVHLLKELKGNDFMRLQNEALVNGGNLPFWTEHQIDSVGAGTDWIKAVTRTGHRHELNLDYSGGSRAYNYLITGNYLREDAAALDNWYERAMVRVKINAQTTSWLNLGLNIAGSFSHGRSGADVLAAGNYSPAILRYAPGGKNGLPDLSQAGASNLLTGSINPIQGLQDSIRGTSNNDPTYNLNTFFTPEIVFSRHLKFNSILNGNIGFDYNKAFYGSYSVYDASNTVLIGQRTPANAAASAAASYNWGIGIQNYFTYSDTFAAVHALNIVAGHRESKSGLGASVSDSKYNYSNNLLQNINNGQERDNAAGNDYTPTTKRSFFGRVNYIYNDKYIAEGTLSYDGTDRFGPNNKYGLFPAGALAWVVTREPFVGKSKWLDYLKVRSSYGVLGNDAIPQFQYYQTINVSPAYPFGSPNYASELGAFPASVANPNVKWESTATLDFGVDWSFLKGWNLVADYYNRNTFNMLFNTPVSQTTGFSSEYLNIGNVSNKGYEIALGYKHTWGDWRLGATATVSHNTNKVTKLFNGITKYVYGPTQSSAFIVGQPTTLIYGVKVLGIYQNAADLVRYPRKNAQLGDYIYQDLNKDSVVTSSDYQAIGNSFPMVSVGLNTSLSWKHLDLSVTLSGAMDYSVVNQSAGGQVTAFNFQYPNSYERWLSYYNSRWRGPGTSSTQPELVAYDTRNYLNGLKSTDLRNGNFIRVRNVQAGYTFGKTTLDKIKMTALRLFMNVSNPLIFSKYYGYDPETSGYPIMRTIAIGISGTL